MFLVLFVLGVRKIDYVFDRFVRTIENNDFDFNSLGDEYCS